MSNELVCRDDGQNTWEQAEPSIAQLVEQRFAEHLRTNYFQELYKYLTFLTMDKITQTHEVTRIPSYAEETTKF